MATREAWDREPKGQRILVVEEKHSTRYFDASTDEKLHAAALKLVRERMDPEYQYILEPEPPEEKVVLSEQQISELPVGSSIRKLAEDERRKYLKERQLYEREHAQWVKDVEAVKRGDGKVALDIMMRRQDYEYEGWNLEYLE